MPKNNDEVSRLIAAPVNEALFVRHQEFDDFCNLACLAISEIQRIPERVAASGHPASEFKASIEMAEIAKREHESGFSTIFNFATVFTWGALETSIRDLAVNWLRYVPESRQRDKIGKLKIRFADYEALDPTDRMRYLVGLLENDLGAGLKPGVARFESLLSEIGLGGPVDDELRRDLIEMAAVRNVIVHRLGVIDEKFVALCPWHLGSPGDRLSITSNIYYEKYRSAAYKYAALVLRRVEPNLPVVDTPTE